MKLPPRGNREPTKNLCKFRLDPNVYGDTNAGILAGVRTKDRMDNLRMPNVHKKKLVCRKIVWDKVRAV